MELDEDDYEALGFGAEKALRDTIELTFNVKLVNIARVRAWAKDNPEKLKQAIKIYRKSAAYKKKARIRDAKYRANNRTRKNAASNKYYHENRTEILQRRAAKRAAKDTTTSKE